MGHKQQPHIDFANPKWRFKERIQRLIAKGRTPEEAEEIVVRVITEKEQDQ